MKSKIKELEINHKNIGDGDLQLSHLEDNGRCHIMTSNYGKVTSTSINKTEAKRIIKWLTKWIKFKEKLEDLK